MTAIFPSLLAVAVGAAVLAGCAAPVPRDVNGVPATARLAPGSTPPAPLNDVERERLATLNQQILREQAAVMAS